MEQAHERPRVPPEVGNGSGHVFFLVQAAPVEAPAGVPGEVGRPGTLGPAVPLPEGMDAVQLAEVVGEPSCEVETPQVAQVPLVGQLAEQALEAREDLPDRGEDGAFFRHVGRTGLPRPNVDVAEQVAVDVPEVAQVIGGRERVLVELDLTSCCDLPLCVEELGSAL